MPVLSAAELQKALCDAAPGGAAANLLAGGALSDLYQGLVLALLLEMIQRYQQPGAAQALNALYGAMAAQLSQANFISASRFKRYAR